MCEALDVKIAIIKRAWLRSTSEVSHESIVSSLLGVAMSSQICHYAARTDRKQIYRHICQGHCIAIALDNLTPNWHG